MHRLIVGSNPYAIEPTDSLRLAEAIEKAEVRQPGAAIGKLMADAEASAHVSQNRCTSIAKLKRRLEGDLGTILLMALRKDPSRRHATVDQFAGDIQNYLTGRPVRARKDTFGYRLIKFVERNRFAAAAGIGAALLLIAGIVGTSTQWIRAEAASKVAGLKAAGAKEKADLATESAKKELQARVAAETAETAAQLAAAEATQQAETASQVSDLLIGILGVSA